MVATVAGTHLAGIHSARPAGNAVPDGSLYSCSTHSLIYASNFVGNSWSTWATLGTSGAIVDPMTTRGDIIVRNPANVTGRLGTGSADTYLGSDGTDTTFSAVTDAKLSTSDITTNNASTSKHGFLKKLSGSATDYMDGSGAWSTPGGGGGGFSTSYLGYNTIGASLLSITAGREYATKITAGGSGNTLLGIQAYLNQTADSYDNVTFGLWTDDSSTIGRLLCAVQCGPLYLGGSGGAGGTYITRWFGAPMTYTLDASTSYWVGFLYITNASAGWQVSYDTGGADRYAVTPVASLLIDGERGSQTDTTFKLSIRALVA